MNWFRRSILLNTLCFTNCPETGGSESQPLGTFSCQISWITFTNSRPRAPLSLAASWCLIPFRFPISWRWWWWGSGGWGGWYWRRDGEWRSGLPGSPKLELRTRPSTFGRMLPSPWHVPARTFYGVNLTQYIKQRWVGVEFTGRNYSRHIPRWYSLYMQCLALPSIISPSTSFTSSSHGLKPKHRKNQKTVL